MRLRDHHNHQLKFFGTLIFGKTINQPLHTGHLHDTIIFVNYKNPQFVVVVFANMQTRTIFVLYSYTLLGLQN